MSTAPEATKGPTIPQLRVITIVLPTIAMSATFFRLVIRARLNKLWWDDAFAFFALISVLLEMAGTLVHIGDPTKRSTSVKIAAYYMCAQFFYAAVWTSRISILFTVIRLSFGCLRQVLVYMSAGFVLLWAILFAQVWWVCETEPSWKSQLIPQCFLGTNVAIAQVITDVACNVVLIAAPVKLLYNIVNRPLKIRLISVFSTTIVTTATSLYHAYVVLRIGGTSEATAALIQTSIGLLIANLTVLVAFLFRLKPQNDCDNTSPLTVTFGGVRRAQETTTMELSAFPNLETHVTVVSVVEKDGPKDHAHGAASSQGSLWSGHEGVNKVQKIAFNSLFSDSDADVVAPATKQ